MSLTKQNAVSPPPSPDHVSRHNGSLTNGDKGRRRSRLALYKRPKANGVKPDVIHNVATPLVSKVSGHINSITTSGFSIDMYFETGTNFEKGNLDTLWKKVDVKLVLIVLNQTNAKCFIFCELGCVK